MRLLVECYDGWFAPLSWWCGTIRADCKGRAVSREGAGREKRKKQSHCISNVVLGTVIPWSTPRNSERSQSPLFDPKFPKLISLDVKTTSNAQSTTGSYYGTYTTYQYHLRIVSSILVVWFILRGSLCISIVRYGMAIRRSDKIPFFHFKK